MIDQMRVSSMKRLMIAFALNLVNLCPAGQSGSATAQPLQNSQVDYAYVEPSNAEYRPIYERLKTRRVLEELRAFLAPLQLPSKVLVKIEQCNKPGRLYQPGEPVTICYEYIARLEELAAKVPADGKTRRGVSREDAVVGAFVQVVLQQMSSAVFEILDVPLWGREEDAADKVAGFLMLQFGAETARKLLNGAAYFFEASDRTWTGSDFSDIRGTEAQRFYNYLCIAYGGDKKSFNDFVEGQRARGPGRQRIDLLPQDRAVRCSNEYLDLKWNFDRTIMPSVNDDLLQKVLVRIWLQPGDGK
jgi:Putative metallopeptidase